MQQPAFQAIDPRQYRRAGSLAAALLALLIALKEISTLSKGFVTPDGAWSFLDLQGPAVWSHLDAWQATLSAESVQNQLASWRGLLLAFIAVDVLFALTYGLALYLIGLRIGDTWFRRLGFALPAVDLIESIGFAVLDALRDEEGAPSWLVVVVAVVTTVKWLVFLALAIRSFVLAWGHWGRVRRLVRALYIQRFSLLAFLPIAALSVVPGPSVLDQLPDVQRQWLDGDVPSLLAELAKPATVHLFFLLPAIFLLGRIRGDWAARRLEDPTWPQPATGKTLVMDRCLWLVGPVILACLAVAVVAFDWGDVKWDRLAAFSSVPILVLVFSLGLWGAFVVNREAPPGWLTPGRPRPITPEFVRDVTTVGDVLAFASLSLAGLGLVRSMTGLVVLDAVDLVDNQASASAVVLLAGGVVGALAPWLLGPPVLARIHDWSQVGGLRGWVGRLLTPGEDAGGWQVGPVPANLILRTSLLALATAAFLYLSLNTVPAATWLGALAATMAALTALVTMLGVTVAYAQERQAPEFFHLGWGWLRFRGTPVIFTFLVAVGLAGVVGGPADIHEIQYDDAEAAEQLADRPDLAESFEDWRDQGRTCTAPLEVEGGELEGRDVTVRPMLMIAAEGGGLRATYWTTAALQQIAASGDGCGRKATLFSNGASGGALGLTVGRFDTTPLDGVRSVSDDDALAVASTAMLTRDVLASAAGIRRFESATSRDEPDQWVDRAGLMELAWQDSDDQDDRLLANEPSFVQPRGQATRGQGSVTGQLILNSTAFRSMCRGLVSQVDVTGGGQESGSFPDCGEEAAGPNSFDLLGAYAACTDPPWALTGGLLASRFPYVTPSGVIDRCSPLDSIQMIDGGYMDNTGLGTLGDLAPQWQQLVARYNTDELTKASPELVVPMVVFLDNGTGKDNALIPGTGSGDPGEASGAVDLPRELRFESAPEVLVPLWGVARKLGRTADARPLLVRANRLATENWCTDPRCGPAIDAVNQSYEQRTFVINQSQQPSLSAPLGWVLSQTSQDDLDHDLCLQMKGSDESVTEKAFPRYGSLADLFTVLGGAPDLSGC